ncbi:restriction endonuclease [bacterium]|nr:MAG: restriction endonuclease [bacterium]
MTAPTAYKLLELLKDLSSQGVSINEDIYEYLSTTDLMAVEKWYGRLQRVKSYSFDPGRPQGALRTKKRTIKERLGTQSALKGRLLEKLIQAILDGCKAISYGHNIRTSSSEVDFLIKIEPLGGHLPMFNSGLTHIIGEAKCYDKKLKKEWVDELAGTASSHNTNFGILFTLCTPRRVHRDMAVSIAIHAAKGNRIIPFGAAQVEQVRKGENFLKLLSDQYVKALTHDHALSV